MIRFHLHSGSFILFYLTITLSWVYSAQIGRPSEENSKTLIFLNTSIPKDKSGNGNGVGNSSIISSRESPNDISKSGWLAAVFVMAKFWLGGFIGFWIVWYLVYVYIVKDHVKINKFPKPSPAPTTLKPGTYNRRDFDTMADLTMDSLFLNALDGIQKYWTS